MLAAHAVAAIRLWPALPSDGPEATECTGLVLSCLHLGVKWCHAQLLMQAAQALTLPPLAAKLCASIPAAERVLRPSSCKRFGPATANADSHASMISTMWVFGSGISCCEA